MATIFSVIGTYYRDKSESKKKLQENLSPIDKQIQEMVSQQLIKNNAAEVIQQRLQWPMSSTDFVSESLSQTQFAESQVKEKPEWQELQAQKAEHWHNYFANKGDLLTRTSKLLSLMDYKWSARAFSFFESKFSIFGHFDNKAARQGLAQYHNDPQPAF